MVSLPAENRVRHARGPALNELFRQGSRAAGGAQEEERACRRKVILDCDPGQDDAIAILLALASPEIDLIAITAVAGNIGIEKTSLNARAVVELAGAATPVYAGCPRPLVREPVLAIHIHGESGIDGATLKPPVRPLAGGHAVDFIRDTIRAHPPGEITLVAIGPLTNLASAIIQAPDIATRAREIVLMGGAIGLGNTTPAAEFNIYADPHAAHVVFKAGVPLVMHGLDVTHQALVTPARLAAIQALGIFRQRRGRGSARVLQRLRPDPPRPPRRPAPRPLGRSRGRCGPSCSPAATATSRSRPRASTRWAARWSTGRPAPAGRPTPRSSTRSTPTAFFPYLPSASRGCRCKPAEAMSRRSSPCPSSEPQLAVGQPVCLREFAPPDRAPRAARSAPS